MIIILQLIEQKILNQPTLYLSAFFEKNKGSYYDSLTVVRQSNNPEQWVKFFLTGVVETAKGSQETFKQIIKLRREYETKILGLF